jgi:hypothetical protein
LNSSDHLRIFLGVVGVYCGEGRCKECIDAEAAKLLTAGVADLTPAEQEQSAVSSLPSIPVAATILGSCQFKSMSNTTFVQ